jgi:hypothetical protein
VLYAANPSTQAVRDHMTAGDLACITTPKQGNRLPDGARLCLDNGVFGKGYPGDGQWWAWVQKHTEHAARVLFVVAPDVVGDAQATLERSAPWLPRIRALGMPAAYVAQDGQQHFEPPWDDFDCLFIGGSTDWKMGPHVPPLIREAKRRGKWVHAGRVNSLRRFAHFELLGCDSADGTYIAFGPDVNLPNVLHWTNSLFGEMTA